MITIKDGSQSGVHFGIIVMKVLANSGLGHYGRHSLCSLSNAWRPLWYHPLARSTATTSAGPAATSAHGPAALAPALPAAPAPSALPRPAPCHLQRHEPAQQRSLQLCPLRLRLRVAVPAQRPITCSDFSTRPSSARSSSGRCSVSRCPSPPSYLSSAATSADPTTTSAAGLSHYGRHPLCSLS